MVTMVEGVDVEVIVFWKAGDMGLALVGVCGRLAPPLCAKLSRESRLSDLRGPLGPPLLDDLPP